MRPTQLLATIASFSALTQAWPWPDFSERNAIMRRQDSSNSESSPSNSATTTAKTSSQPEKSTSATNTKSSDTKASGSQSASGSGTTASATNTGNSDSGNDTAAATTSFDASNGLASIVMVNPSALAGSQYYKVGDYLTWGWNYTNVQATPTAVDLWAYCSAAKATYTLATNMTYEETGKFTWDTAAYATQAPQLGTNSYTLSIADAGIGMASSKGAGYLNPVAMYTFAMYTPQPYTNYSSWVCATCNSGAGTLTPKNTWSFLGGMASVTVLSFTWFATGRFGVL
ncbi:ATP-dependent 6-phosphofructokinase [Venturia nashicola]|uniref:ATP-dependent 6-phosphofructokinase n=1 Tax=Venturia nashicola TaxID=86259 RepID=A0A4Z1P7T7_9PEZI|nr:ATP-dependent 6-phosphofructokinase [Venturia nashicola]TLD37495.1 ATP-dependent 6-phosphofructokinase [Venturia nashicola]